MILFNPELPKKEKETWKHPWEATIKPALSHKIKYLHNSASNLKYPPPKKTVYKARVKYTVIGNRLTKEFIYCSKIVRGLHKYRPAHFEAPVIRGVTSVEWPEVLNKLKTQYGGLAFGLQSELAVIANDKFLGGENELRENVRKRYYYDVSVDYCKEAIDNLASYIKSSERSFVYMHISIDDKHVGTLIFMLYTDIVPQTCENFLRLCRTMKGGYSGTPVHRIVKDSWIQCGGFGLKSTELDCENFIVLHDRRGVISMANDGRHVDCSTQFFVLLQPSVWMSQKYVAFGQLIEGDETLRKIESVPTFYESPTSSIIIFRTGELDLHGQDVRVNEGTKEYLEGHVDNLVDLGEVLYEELLVNVFKEREPSVVSEPEEIIETLPGEDLRETKRFIRVKREQHDTSKMLVEEVKENNEFDEEKSEYTPEDEGLYQHMSLAGSLDIKPVRPYYLPLTDVPCSGDEDSTFNLLKFLKGDYCIEENSETRQRKKCVRRTLSFQSEIFSQYFSDQSSTGDVSMDSEDEMELKRYLKYNADRVSFAGSIVKSIAKTWGPHPGTHNLFENVRRSDLVVEEDVKRFSRKVFLTAPVPKEEPKRILRRPTGFVRSTDLELHFNYDSDSSSSIPGDSEDSSRKSTMDIQDDLNTGRKSTLKRLTNESPRFTTSSWQDSRPSAFVHLFGKKSYVEAPTLKQEMLAEPSKTVLLRESDHKLKNHVDDKYTRSPMISDSKSYDRMLNILHGKKAAHKISSDYVKTMDQMEQQLTASIRTIEFAKIRPSTTVSKYQLKNRQFNKNLTNEGTRSPHKLPSGGEHVRAVCDERTNTS